MERAQGALVRRYLPPVVRTSYVNLRMMAGRVGALKAVQRRIANRNASIQYLAQVIADRDQAVLDRDATIRQLEHAVAERDQAVLDRDATIRQLEHAVAEQRGGADTSEPEPLPSFLETSVEQGLGDLTTEYAELERFVAAHQPLTPEDESDLFYQAFTSMFRGPEPLIAQRQAEYLPSLQIPEQNRGYPVLDVGCGRGEFLGLLSERGIKCIGVDSNSRAVARLRQLGHEVHQADAVKYLRTLRDNAVAAITAFQVVEHLQYDYLREFLRLAHAKLASEGFILLETVNPYCLETYRYYYLDPTHLNPVPKDLLAVTLKFYGFRDLQAFYQDPLGTTSPVSQPERIRRYQTYALIGRKGASGHDGADGSGPA